MISTITAGSTVGTMVGGIAGGAIGCVLGGIAGATVASATIVGLFGAFIPAAAIACVSGVRSLERVSTTSCCSSQEYHHPERCTGGARTFTGSVVAQLLSVGPS